MNSLWKDTVTLPSFGRLNHDLKTDVLIIGGGIGGILCAYMLEAAGINYALIEADKICSGVTGNTTAKITCQHGLIYAELMRKFGEEKARMYLEANQAALEDYMQLCKDIPCDFEKKTSYVYQTQPSADIEKELAALSKIGFNAEYVDSLSLPIKTYGAVKLKNQAQFNPLKFISKIARGLNIFESTPARAYDGKVVLTNFCRITAEKIIVATHFPFINKHGSYFLKMYQHRSYVLALENCPNFDGMYVDADKYGLSFRNYKNALFIGGGSHRTGKQGGAWTPLEAFAKTCFPNAREAHRWATQDCMTLDGIPYIGQYSKNTPNFYVACGFNKWGMTSAMAAARILTDLVQDKENPYTSLFSPSRTILRPQLVINAVETVTNLLTLTKPRCPHMGCALKWNAQEHSWDCPCHGSRFSESGKLLKNPATGDLNRD